jgi:hypothetical protein
MLEILYEIACNGIDRAGGKRQNDHRRENREKQLLTHILYSFELICISENAGGNETRCDAPPFQKTIVASAGSERTLPACAALCLQEHRMVPRQILRADGIPSNRKLPYPLPPLWNCLSDSARFTGILCYLCAPPSMQEQQNGCNQACDPSQIRTREFRFQRERQLLAISTRVAAPARTGSTLSSSIDEKPPPGGGNGKFAARRLYTNGAGQIQS